MATASSNVELDKLNGEFDRSVIVEYNIYNDLY